MTLNEAPAYPRRDDAGKNLYGCLKQLNLLKTKHRHLRVLLSLGGWTFSANFSGFGRSAAHRQAFARSAVQLVEDYGFDGLDIDVSPVCYCAMIPPWKSIFPADDYVCRPPICADDWLPQWEYPKDATEAAAYTELLREVREELDRHEIRPDGSRACFELTVRSTYMFSLLVAASHPFCDACACCRFRSPRHVGRTSTSFSTSLAWTATFRSGT